jgi:hypothetical protein
MAIGDFRRQTQNMELIGLEWIRDGLRKNCATHLRAVYKKDYEVILDMGNSVRVLLANYAKLAVPEEVSDDYWKITPARVKKYMKSAAWKKIISARATKPEPLANGSGKASY